MLNPNASDKFPMRRVPLESFTELARRLRGAPGLAAIEVNISCPNVADRGLVFACSPTASSDVVGAVRGQTRADPPLAAAE